MQMPLNYVLDKETRESFWALRLVGFGLESFNETQSRFLEVLASDLRL